MAAESSELAAKASEALGWTCLSLVTSVLNFRSQPKCFKTRLAWPKGSCTWVFIIFLSSLALLTKEELEK